MVRSTPAPDLPDGLDERLRVAPEVCPDRLHAGRERVAGGPVHPLDLADAVVAEHQQA
jgi:hypothetical protein